MLNLPEDDLVLSVFYTNVQFTSVTVLFSSIRGNCNDVDVDALLLLLYLFIATHSTKECCNQLNNRT